VFTVEQSVTINRPVEQVFGFLADHGNDGRWRTDIAETRGARTGGAKGAFEQVIKFMGNKTFGFEVTKNDPNREHEFRAVSGPGVRPTVSYTLEPSGQGARLTSRISVQTYGLFRLMTPMMPGMVKKSWAGYLVNLKRELEA
jgi:uncharacterized protein YndB with AHSA1/START domain